MPVSSSDTGINVLHKGVFNLSSRMCLREKRVLFCGESMKRTEITLFSNGANFILFSQVSTHSDNYDAQLLADDFFTSMLEDNRGFESCQARWVARYTVVDPDRSVIVNQGYLVTGRRLA